MATASRAGAVTKPASKGASSVQAGPVPSSFSAFTQALAVRIELDEPLPVGPGDIPSVTGQLNSAQGFSTGTVAADLLGAVVGPDLQDPTNDGHQYMQLPQATCVYPTQPSDAQSYPFDGSNQQTVESQVTCGSGPSVKGLTYAAMVGGQAGLTNPTELQNLGLSSLPMGANGVSSGSESLGPDQVLGAVVAKANAEITNFDIPGILSASSIDAQGYSQATGRPGGATSHAQVVVHDLRIGTATISLGPKGVELGTGPSVPVSDAQSVVSEFNQVAQLFGCNLTLLSSPSTYPQGPLFARPPLPDEVLANGMQASSTAGGALVRCVVPSSLNPTKFKPLILQIIFGFVATQAVVLPSQPALGTGLSSSDSAGGAPMAPASSSPSPSLASSMGLPYSGAGAPSLVPAPSRQPARAVKKPLMRPALGQLVTVKSPISTSLQLLALALALVSGGIGMFLLGPWRIRPVGAHLPGRG